MNSNPDVIIAGAGPYGLSIAAHLQFHGIKFRIFGSPLSVWRSHMPEGMYLKSDGFASNLSDPESRFTLKDYCGRREFLIMIRRYRSGCIRSSNTATRPESQCAESRGCAGDNHRAALRRIPRANRQRRVDRHAKGGGGGGDFAFRAHPSGVEVVTA